MSIQDLGAIGDFVGSIGVIVTLIYLAIQIRANTRATRGSAGFDATHSWANLNETLSGQSDEYLEPFVSLIQNTDLSQLTDVQYLRYVLFMRAMFQKLEGQYYLFKYGLLEPALWEQRSSVGKGFIQQDRFGEWWESEKMIKTFSPEFVQAIEEAPGMDATLINRRLDS